MEIRVNTVLIFVLLKLLIKVSDKNASGGVILLPFNEKEVSKIQNLKDFDKKIGVTDSRIIAMFEDEIETLKDLLKLIEN